MITGQQIGGIAARGLGMQGGVQAQYDTEIAYAEREAVNGAPELTAAIDRAASVRNNLSDLRETLEIHLNRILGTQPVAGSIGNKPASDPDCAMAALRSELIELDAVAYQLRNQVERLARL